MGQQNKLNLIAATAVALHLWELTTSRKCFQAPMTEADKGPQTVPHKQRCTQVKRKVKPTQGLQMWLLDLTWCFLENSVICLEATSKPEPGEKSSSYISPPTLSQSMCLSICSPFTHFFSLGRNF